jgi:hypothetical protein
MSGTEVNVENVHQMVTEADVSSKNAAFFPPRYRQVNMADRPELESSERYVPVRAATMLAGLANRVNVSELGRQVGGLVVLNGLPLVVDNLL